MADFSINIKTNGEINIVELTGYLDAHTAPELENAFSGLIAENKYKIVVNFFNLKYISSAGLGVFMAFIENVRGNGGDIKLAAMQPNVFNIFDLLGFPLLYEIFDTEEEAINKFNSK
jgi:anti-sigma B factor antagonist